MRRESLEWISDEAERRIFQRRTLFALGIIGLVFCAILLRLFVLQMIRGESYLALSERNRIREYRITPPRGLIFDRNGRLLVDNRLGFNLIYNPASRKKRLDDEQLRIISTILGLELDELKDAMKQASIYKPSRIAVDIDYSTVAKLEEAFNIIGRDTGFEIQPTPKRNYRYPQVVPHFLGHMGEVCIAHLKSEPGVYREGDLVGKAGIEKALEKELRGKAGREWVEENAFHQRIRTLRLEPATPGKNVYLTIDLELNLELVKIFGQRAGAAVVMDARTGDILAAHSSPWFDPSIFGRSLSPQVWKQLESDPSHPLLNKVISGLYPPGSVFKPVVALAALKYGVLTPESTVFCPGIYRLGSFEYRCWKRDGHGLLSLHRAIVESCDVYFYRVAEQVGIDRLAEFARACGFGKRTGIG
ncbi:MAG TPA: penicillin-binding protein 2, partial [Proteobacteria bacterium]|nr:penicillin-binding protein 2 [Pseudomonadota bacterium]